MYVIKKFANMIRFEPGFEEFEGCGVGLGGREGDLVGEIIVRDALIFEGGGASEAFDGAENDKGVIERVTFFEGGLEGFVVSAFDGERGVTKAAQNLVQLPFGFASGNSRARDFVAV